ncbi:MAG: hypothetical protein K6T83_22760 [Alicyclobacillus sp.]|nr:hypothetical protein [Alicyclobacillus sp.]
MYFAYASDGTILQCGPNQSLLSPDLQILEADDSNPTTQAAAANISLYKVVNGQLVKQPYITLTVTSNGSGSYTATATLNNVQGTPPSSVSFQILGQSFSVPASNNQASLSITIHPSITGVAFGVQAYCDGFVGTSANAGEGTQYPVAIQAFQTSSGDVMIAPVGPGSKHFLASYYALSAGSLETYLADIGTVISLLTDAVFNVLFPAVNPTLNANQQNAYNDIKANALPNLFTTLSNAYPSGGQRQLQYADYLAGLASTFKAYENYMQDLETIPGLE